MNWVSACHYFRKKLNGIRDDFAVEHEELREQHEALLEILEQFEQDEALTDMERARHDENVKELKRRYEAARQEFEERMAAKEAELQAMEEAEAAERVSVCFVFVF